jgi:hypothetical protein
VKHFFESCLVVDVPQLLCLVWLQMVTVPEFLEIQSEALSIELIVNANGSASVAFVETRH